MKLNTTMSVNFSMSALSEQIKRLAELNFCENCYSKYVVLIHGNIEYLLSEPLADWRETEANINIIWIKAKGLSSVTPTGFSVPDGAFKKARKESVYDKLEFLKEEGIIKNSTYEFLNKVRKIRNKVHPPSKFSKQDYFLFREAKALTDSMFLPIIHELKDDRWVQSLANVEKRAKYLLEKNNSVKIQHKTK